jgi:hypothetical protein
VIGEYSLEATFYDAEQNVVTKATKPVVMARLSKLRAQTASR